MLIAEVENALIKRAKGFSYDEIKTYIEEENGRKVKYTEKSVKTVAPDTGACAILLKNKDKDHYSDQPAMLELKREMLELQKEAMKLKEW